MKNAKTSFPSIWYFFAFTTISWFNFCLPRMLLKKSDSIFSPFWTPLISNLFPLCLTPRTIHPPDVLENALTLFQMFLGSSAAASFTSKSSHSMSLSLAMSSFLVIEFFRFFQKIGNSPPPTQTSPASVRSSHAGSCACRAFLRSRSAAVRRKVRRPCRRGCP